MDVYLLSTCVHGEKNPSSSPRQAANTKYIGDFYLASMAR